MIHPNASDTATVRSVFVIGPDNKVKLTLTYPASTGRNFDEILRVIDSLQLTANYSVATPADWKEGEDVIIVPAVSDEDAKAKFPKGFEGREALPPRDPATEQVAASAREASSIRIPPRVCGWTLRMPTPTTSCEPTSGDGCAAPRDRSATLCDCSMRAPTVVPSSTQLSAATRALQQAGFRLLASNVTDCVTCPDDDRQGPDLDELERLFMKL